VWVMPSRYASDGRNSGTRRSCWPATDHQPICQATVLVSLPLVLLIVKPVPGVTAETYSAPGVPAGDCPASKMTDELVTDGALTVADPADSVAVPLTGAVNG